jgi:hypothetical protein
MTFIAGKALQAAGIALIPLALYYGIARNDLRAELRVWVAGLAIFGVGWLLERNLSRR